MTARAVLILGSVLAFGFLLLNLVACGGGSPSASGPGYTLTATALSPNPVSPGSSATSTITATSQSGYSGTVTFSCSSVTGGTPAPACSFNPSSATVSSSAPGSSTLTVSTSSSTPGGGYSIAVTGSDANKTAPSNGAQALTMSVTGLIKNVVIIFQENRTPDNLFQGLCISPYGSPSNCSTSPSATQYNIQTSNWLNNQSSSGVTQPGVIDLGTVGEVGNPDNYDLSHAHSAFTEMCDLNSSTNQCAMDGAAQVICTPASGDTCPTNPQYFYVYPEDVAPYLQMAQTYSFADQMFQTNEGPSFPAHQFILAGTSSPSQGSNLFVAENPGGDTNGDSGCTASPGTTVELINPLGQENQSIFPCLEHETLTDLLDAANLSWRYYAPSLGSLWTAPAAINHMCVPNPAPPNATACTGTDFTASSPKVVLNQNQTNAQILTDIAENQLQTVSWIIPDGHDSDHAESNDGCGPSWVTSIVNAIGGSPYWSDTVIIIAWDDWGGWYDHVQPPQIIDDGTSWGSGYVYGFRVPMIVISPYAKTAYVSHATHDFGSILKFIETNYGLPSLGVADANADNLSDIFQYNQAAAFTPISVPWDDATCKSQQLPATDPDDD
jgi:phospholipase C